MPELVEPLIYINGQQLSIAQSMTLRAALNSFAFSLEDGLGDDEHGKKMTENYSKRIFEIVEIMQGRVSMKPNVL